MLLDHRVVHAADRLLDLGDLAAGRIDGAGGGGRLGPVPEDRPGSVHFLPGPDDGDDLDGSALSLERVPRDRAAGTVDRTGGIVLPEVADEQNGYPGLVGHASKRREDGSHFAVLPRVRPPKVSHHGIYHDQHGFDVLYEPPKFLAVIDL